MSEDLVKRLRSYAKDQGGWHNIDDTCEAAAELIERLSAENEKLRQALSDLVEAPALAGIRALVAGWNGEGREGGPFIRHPDTLGANLPTCCGDVYNLDEAMQAARAALSEVRHG